MVMVAIGVYSARVVSLLSLPGMSFKPCVCGGGGVLSCCGYGLCFLGVGWERQEKKNLK